MYFLISFLWSNHHQNQMLKMSWCCCWVIQSPEPTSKQKSFGEEKLLMGGDNGCWITSQNKIFHSYSCFDERASELDQCYTYICWVFRVNFARLNSEVLNLLFIISQRRSKCVRCIIFSKNKENMKRCIFVLRPRQDKW